MAVPGDPSVHALCQEHRARQAEQPGERAQRWQQPRQLASRRRSSPDGARRTHELHRLFCVFATYTVSLQIGILKGNGG
jgi:hypothetical protein